MRKLAYLPAVIVLACSIAQTALISNASQVKPQPLRAGCFKGMRQELEPLPHLPLKNPGVNAGVSSQAINHSHKIVEQNKVVWFNSKSYKYHEPDCESVKSCTNCIEVSLKEAESRGGVACKACSGEWIEMP